MADELNNANLVDGYGDSVRADENGLVLTAARNKNINLRTSGTGNVEVNGTPIGGGGAVISVFGRAGVVVAQTGDYLLSQIGGLVSTPNLALGDGQSILSFITASKQVELNAPAGGVVQLNANSAQVELDASGDVFISAPNSAEASMSVTGGANISVNDTDFMLQAPSGAHVNSNGNELDITDNIGNGLSTTAGEIALSGSNGGSISIDAGGDINIDAGGNVTIDGQLGSSFFTVGGDWAVEGPNGIIHTGGAGNGIIANVPITPGAFTVAALPAGVEGMTAYATNGRKIGEGAGAGTGVPVYFSNGVWRTFRTDTAVLA